MDVRDALPIHPLPDGERLSDARPRELRIAGLVAEPRILADEPLAALPHVRLTEPFVCEEGWTVNGLTWEGIPLREILALGQPLTAARYVRVRAGEYWIALALDEIERAFLCDRLNGEWLTRQHGAPWRLVVSGGACFTSVKWVDTLELAAEPGAATAERIARSRIDAENTD